LARNFNEVAGFRVVAVGDLQPSRLKAARLATQESTQPRHRPTAARPDIDAVAIATPVSSHFDLAMRALQNGKNVLLEKRWPLLPSKPIA